VRSPLKKPHLIQHTATNENVKLNQNVINKEDLRRDLKSPKSSSGGRGVLAVTQHRTCPGKKTTLETSAEDPKITLETSGEDPKTTL
jgi:hypothetical protein